MRALLLSPDGMLGRAWAQLLAAEGVAHETRSFPAFDLTSEAALDAVPWGEFDVAINCAAWTDVDGAEAKEETATAVNGHGVAAVATRCAAGGTTLVHYSTDYVFPGVADAPYPVDAPLRPINAYGRSKAVGERGIADAGGSFLLLRTSWLYAPWGGNFVRTMARLGGEREQLRVVDDQRGRPSSAQHLARASLQLLRAGATGTLHVTDGGACTWFEFATAIVRATHPECRVDPCTSAEFPRPAKRPGYSVLDLGPTEAILGPTPSWQDNLAAVLAEIE